MFGRREKPAADETAASDLKDAVREARIEAAERSAVIVDLRDAELARLELLNEALDPVFKDIPADAKEGLKLTFDAIHDLPDDASAEDMAGMDADFSDAEQKKVDAFSDYLEKTCPDVGDSSEPDTDSGSGSSDGSEDSEPSEGSS